MINFFCFFTDFGVMRLIEFSTIEWLIMRIVEHFSNWSNRIANLISKLIWWKFCSPTFWPENLWSLMNMCELFVLVILCIQRLKRRLVISLIKKKKSSWFAPNARKKKLVKWKWNYFTGFLGGYVFWIINSSTLSKH